MNKEDFEAYFVIKSVAYAICNLEIRKENLLLFKSKDYLDLFKNIVLTFNELEILDDDIKDNACLTIQNQYIDIDHKKESTVHRMVYACVMLASEVDYD